MIDTAINHDVQTRRELEPHLKDVLRKLVAEHPKAPKEELCELYGIEARARESLLDEAIRRAFERDLWSVQPRRRAKPVRQTAAEIAQRVEHARGLLLLELTLPNGKILREASGRECKQAGGWFTLVAQRVGPNGIVGDKLTEEQVRAIAAGKSGKPQRRK